MALTDISIEPAINRALEDRNTTGTKKSIIIATVDSDGDYQRIQDALIDSGVKLNVVKEGTRNQLFTTDLLQKVCYQIS